MRTYLAFAVGVVGIVGSVSLPVVLNEPKDTIWPIPQRDDSVRWMTEKQAIKKDLFTEEVDGSRNFDKVRFFLFTQNNPYEHVELAIEDPENLTRSTFDFRNPTRLMIHGWSSGYSSDKNRLIREALLLNGKKKQFNFIVVDWSVYSNSPTYINSQKSCLKTGKIVAQFLDWMHDTTNLSFDTLALYGHSLGAHVAGFAGKNVQRGQIDTIVALDAAMPLFRYSKPKKRLADTDAKYVESIHTNGGLLGFHKPIGKASFYPNGGKVQPGCGTSMFCSHGRSVEYFAEALRTEENNGFQAIKCKEYVHFSNSTCSRYENRVNLGDPNNAKIANGIYFLVTNNDAPYGVGRS